MGEVRPVDVEVSATHVPDIDGQGLVSDPALFTSCYNGSTAPPSVAFASANPYLARPLPAPPSRLKMSQRPSTSGGSRPKDNGKVNFNFDNRMSRDDFFVGTRSKLGAEVSLYHGQLRGQLPTPDSSPRSMGRHEVIPIVRMPTPDSFEDPGARGIGMALGSPSHPPPNWGSVNPQASLRAPQTIQPVSPASALSSVDEYDMPREKPTKPGKWKLFGIFGKKNQAQSITTVSISEPNELKGPYRAPPPESSPQMEIETRPARSRTMSTRKTPKHKPIVVRSNTMPVGDNAPTDEWPSVPLNKPLAMTGNNGYNAASGSQHSSSSKGLLDVEIPSITMERYSVMFGNVLSSQPASSLLARRQATLDKLKHINEAITKEEEDRIRERMRRATSPHPTKSPAFSLFPTTPSAIQQQNIPPPRVSPLSRSNTSPAVLSPARATFDYRSPSSHRKTPSDEYAKGKAAASSPSRARKPVPKSIHFKPNESNLDLDSFSDDDDEEIEVTEIVRSQSIRPKIQEPKWQMIQTQEPGPSVSGSTGPSISVSAGRSASGTTSPSSSRKTSPASSTSIQTTITRPSLELDESRPVENADPVEISIARQISISRQQRKLLQPLQTSFSPTKGKLSPARSGTVPTPKIAMGKNERLGETYTSTPILVTPVDSLNTPQSALANRRSELVVFEAA